MQDPLYPKLITDALKTVRYPGTGKNIVESNMLADDMRIEGRKVSFSIIFDKPTDPFVKSIIKAAEAAILTHVGADVEIKGNISAVSRQEPQEKVKPLQGVRNIIGISSGKGGVGKSTVAANIAVALAREGYKVGLLDADIFGPSVPTMFGVSDAELYMHEVNGRNLIIPYEKFGVKVLSIGFLVEKNSAQVWRGGMASRALTQLITDADWGELDYFLIDMPPGTSDIHLTLVQTLALTGIAVVTTPQEVALADARRGITMFRDPRINVPILGLIENMAWFTPAPHPEEKYYIFGKEGGRNLAEQLQVRLLGEIPLVLDIRQHSDNGEPIALSDSIAGHCFCHIARELIDAVNIRNNELPETIVVQVNK